MSKAQLARKFKVTMKTSHPLELRKYDASKLSSFLLKYTSRHSTVLTSGNLIQKCTSERRHQGHKPTKTRVQWHAECNSCDHLNKVTNFALVIRMTQQIQQRKSIMLTRCEEITIRLGNKGVNACACKHNKPCSSTNRNVVSETPTHLIMSNKTMRSACAVEWEASSMLMH